MKVVCPGCQSELDPTNTNCPVCLRPRSRKEMLEGLKDTRKSAPTRWWRAALVLAAVGAAGYAGLGRLDAPAPPAAATAPVVASTTTTPAAPPADSPIATLAALENRTPPAAAPASASGTVLLKSAPAPRAERRRPARRAAPRPARPKGWRVHGEVYDLLTLRPVRGARIVFQDKDSGRAFTAAADASGRYSIDLPKLDEGGYELTVSARKYSGVYLEEMAPPYRSQSKTRRLEAVQQYSQSAVLHVPLLPDGSATDVPYDLVLFPRE